MSNLAKLEQELATTRENVDTCNTMLEMEPNDADAKETKAMMEDLIADLEQQITIEKQKQTEVAPPPPPPTGDHAPPPLPKYDMSKHPKFQKQTAEPPPPPPDDPQQQTVFNVKDVVMAKWSEDKQWYQATIVTKTGSSSDPVYTVTFKGYGNTETKRKHEIRPMHHESKKRKADGPPTVSTPQLPPEPTPAHVISAAPAVNPSLVQQKREPSKVSDGPTRMPPEPKKLKGNKALEKGKASWQAWSAKGPAKAGAAGLPKKKESMFRTTDLPNAKVGFTGSGKPMSKDQARSKWQFAGRDAQGED